MLDASRRPFSWTGIITNPDHWRLAGIALLVSILLSMPILAASTVTLWQTARLRQQPMWSAHGSRVLHIGTDTTFARRSFALG